MSQALDILSRKRFPQRILAIALLIVFAVPVNSAIAQDAKRGLGANDGSLANAVNSRWAYDWNYQSPNGYNGEYVPMFWSGGNLNTKINAIKGYSNTQYVLGFNEPERADQANMSVANAINQWGTISSGFAGTGIKLVSPAVSDTASGRAWLDDFMTQVDADANLVVDEVAFHWYGTVNINNPTGTANSFLNKVDQYHNNYGRNVWVTEFAGIDFGGNYTTEQMNDWNASFLQTAIAGLESRSYVTRYAWWNHNNDSRLATKDSYGLWRPTKVGDRYNKTLLAGDTKDMNGSGVGLDMIYLRGGGFVNSGGNLGNAVGRIYAMSNHDGTSVTSTIGGSGNWGMHSWGSMRVEENAWVRKVGTGTVTMRNLDIYHDGTIQLAGGSGNEGTLWISGSGTNARGNGLLRLENGSTLRLGNSADSSGFELPYEIQYRGGKVQVDGVGINLSGDATIINQTTFEVNQDFVISGNFLGNSPGIVKRGSATMSLNGNNQYAGFTTINEGTLAVNGSINGNNVLINDGGTLAGDGVIASDIIARNGATVTPGNSAGTLTANGAVFNSGSTLILEIESATEFDRLLLSDALTVDSGATLQIDFLAGYEPIDGLEFDVLDFDTFNGMFGTIVVSNGQTVNLNRFQSDGVLSFTTTAVPEPAGWMVLLGFAVGSTLRRRKNS